MRLDKLPGVGLVGSAVQSGQRRLKGFMIDALGISRPPVNPAPPDGPSIVVLPFVNTSGDDAYDYVSDGVTDDLIVALGTSSRYFFVISSESAFGYKGEEVDVPTVAKELGVRYVLQGAAALERGTVSVSARLSEGATGAVLWEDKYEAKLDDIRALNAEITERILVAVGAEVETAELSKLADQPVKDVGAVEAIWGGTYHLRQVTRVDLVRARELFEHAIELDPGLLGAYAFLAGTYTQEYSNGWSADPTLLDRAGELARKAVDSDTPSAAGFAILGIVHILREEWKEAVDCENRAIELEPNVMWPYALRGMALAEGRKWMDATRSIKQALRLAPVKAHGLLIMLAYINYGAGRRDEAVALLEQVRAVNTDNLLVRIALAAFYAREGRLGNAKDCVREILAVNPEMNVPWAMSLIPALEGVTGRKEFQQYPQHLEEAGLPAA